MVRQSRERHFRVENAIVKETALLSAMDQCLKVGSNFGTNSFLPHYDTGNSCKMDQCIQCPRICVKSGWS